MTNISPADASATGQWASLRPIIESLADGIVIVDSRGEIRFANPAAARLFNRAADDLLGTPFGTPIVAGETTEMEILRRGGGDIVYAELRVVETSWEGETVDLVSLREITDRKHAEERSRQLAAERDARLEAEAASQAKSDFLAIMSHELRTPLNAILGYSELMELGISGEMSDSMRKQVGRIRISAKHLLGLVNDILDLAKVEAGRLKVAALPASVSDAMTSAVTLIQPQAATKNIELGITPGFEKLPPYVGDDERVRQILINLLSNAVKCTAAGGSIAIEATLTPPDAGARRLSRKSYICVRVTDTGTGIPEDKLDAIFEPFVQAESGPTRPQEGSGLGLTIGRRLARAMGGDLTVASEIEKGSTFALWLPAAERQDADASAREQATPNPPELDAIAAAETTGKPRAEHQVRGLAAVARTVFSKLHSVVETVVGRICCDPAVEMAKGLRSTQVANHLPTLLTDILSSLAVVEESSGKPSQMLADAMEIQRLVAERHGAQRARLGWTEQAIRREFMIIREELQRAVREAVPLDGELPPGDATGALSRFVDQAEYLAVRALERELEH